MVNHIGDVMVSIFTLSVQWSTTSVTVTLSVMVSMVSIFTLSVQWSTTSVR